MCQVSDQAPDVQGEWKEHFYQIKKKRNTKNDCNHDI